MFAKVYDVTVQVVESAYTTLTAFAHQQNRPLDEVLAALLAYACTISGSPWRNVQAALHGETIWTGIDFCDTLKNLHLPTEEINGFRVPSLEKEVREELKRYTSPEADSALLLKKFLKEAPTYVVERYAENFEGYRQAMIVDKDTAASFLLNRTLYHDLPYRGERKYVRVLNTLLTVSALSPEKTLSVLLRMEEYEKKIHQQEWDEMFNSTRRKGR